VPDSDIVGSSEEIESVVEFTRNGGGKARGEPQCRSWISLALDPGYTPAMDDFPIAPPIVIKDMPKPRRLTKLSEARTYVDEAMRIGRPEPWREVWHRLRAVASEEDAIEAMGDLRELLEEEDLLLPSRE
jgi:hypothetical protein